MRSERKQIVEQQVRDYLTQYPQASWQEVWTQVPNHYADASSLRVSLREELKDLQERRIKRAPDGVLTNTDQQQAIMNDGRGVAQGSPDAINVKLGKKGQVVPWERGEGAYEGMSGAMNVGYDLLSRYIDYEQMDDYSELSATLDVYADDATTIDAHRRHMIWATGDDAMVRDIVDDLLYRRLDVEADAWSTIRTMAKYGQGIAEIIANENGVVGLNYLPPASMRKVLDHKGIVQGYVQSTTGNFTGMDAVKFAELMATRNKDAGPTKDGWVVFAPWEIVWWQIPSKQVRAPYGVSVFDAARWAWKRLTMLEDSAIVNRITKNSRYVYYVDTQDMPPREATSYLQQVKQMAKKKKVVDPQTGQIDFRFNAQAQDEDVYVPVRGGREATRIDVLPGIDIEFTDLLEYFRAKMFAALRVPKNYFGMDQEVTRANLSQMDVMFARTVMRIQRMYMTGLLQVVRLHLALLDVDPDSYNVGLDMTTPSTILEMSQIEVGNARAALAQGMGDYYDKRSILTKVFGETDLDADNIVRAKQKEGLDEMQSQGEVQNRIASMMGGQEGGTGEDDGTPEDTEEAPVSAEEFQFTMKRLERLIDERMGQVKRETDRIGQETRQVPRALQRLEARLARTQVIQERKNRVV